jgi:hypothetical protein
MREREATEVGHAAQQASPAPARPNLPLRVIFKHKGSSSSTSRYWKQLGGSSSATGRVEMHASTLDGYKDQLAAAENPNPPFPLLCSSFPKSSETLALGRFLSPSTGASPRTIVDTVVIAILELLLLHEESS